MSFNYEPLEIEIGWNSKNYSDNIITNNIPTRKRGMLYIEIIANLNKKYNLY